MGLRVYLGEPGKSAFSTYFGGKVVTDARGHFTLTDLVPGVTYDVDVTVIKDYSWCPVKQIKLSNAKALDLGELRVDAGAGSSLCAADAGRTDCRCLLRQPTNIATTTAAEVARRSAPRTHSAIAPVRLAQDPACVELFRLFHEDSEEPSKLRWEFELASLDISQMMVPELAHDLGIPAGKDLTPILAVLDDAGTLVATHLLQTKEKNKLDAPALTAFLRKHKLNASDRSAHVGPSAEKAKAEDKHVFFIASASWCGPCRRLSRLSGRTQE